MNVINLLYWIAIGILVGALLLLIGNKLLTGIISVNVNVTPG